MRIIKLKMPWGTNLYRYTLGTHGLLSKVDFFNKNPEVRAIVGRWSDCPNLNVLKRVDDVIHAATATNLTPIREAIVTESLHYAINVRAIVRVTLTEEGGGGLVKGSPWEIYDVEHHGGQSTIRCDTLVRVPAPSQEEAVATAERDAPMIKMSGCTIDDITIWVDPRIDINPEYAQDKAPEIPGF